MKYGDLYRALVPILRMEESYFLNSDLITRNISNCFRMLKLLPILVGPGDLFLCSRQLEDGSRR